MQKPTRLSAAAGILALLALPAVAQYPSKPITFIVPFSAGGESDLSGRILAQHAQKYLNNQPIVVVNRVGASGAIGSMAVKTAAPDGYTLLVGRIGSHAILPAVDTKVPYQWNDFTMLSLLEFNPYVCAVKGDSPIRSMRGLVDLPDVPTSRELGWPDMERITGWTALMGPPGMAKEAVDKWIGVLGKLASDSDWLAENARIGGIPAIRSPVETENFVRDQYELYKRLATSLNIRE